MRSARPKVLHALGGSALLTHVLNAARALKPARICVVYGHGGGQIMQAMAGATDLVFVKQAKQLGTAHALAQAVPQLKRGGRTLVLYGDVPLITPATLRTLLRRAGNGAALLTAELDDPSGYGRILRDERDAVTGIVEHRDASLEQLEIREINSGILALPTNKIAGWLKRISNRNSQREYYLTDVVALALADGVRVASAQPQTADEILGVNSPAQLAELERHYQARQVQALLDRGVTLADPARVDVRGTLSCGRDVRIDINTVFEGSVKLGADVDIGAHCVIRNAVIGTGTRIAPFSHIDGAVIGARCRIGPYARLRPGAVLAAEAHAGNFVEIKNSSLGAGSKANHLSYIGDADVGRNVNIGAGVITCNYDGVNKHRTDIGDGAFIGSDSQLIAPVSVGRGATIGAGSTITEDAPAGQLTLTRPAQVTVEGWRRPQRQSLNKPARKKGQR